MKGRTPVNGHASATLFAPTAFGDTEGGDWCNSVRTNLFEATYMPTEIRPYSRHRRNCDRRKQGRFRRGYMDVFTPCHRIACAKGAPQVMDYTVAGSSANTNLGTFSWKLY